MPGAVAYNGRQTFVYVPARTAAIMPTTPRSTKTSRAARNGTKKRSVPDTLEAFFSMEGPLAAHLPGYEARSWFGLMAPAKVPKEIVARLNAEVGKILASADVRDRFITEGIEPIGGTSEQFGAFIRDEITKYAKVVKAANLKGE